MVKAKCGSLPAIPEKVYFTIGEVAALCAVKTHVIRYWESEFQALSPVRRRNRRYYKRKDIELIRQISTLLYKEGYTIEGARQCLQRKIEKDLSPEVKVLVGKQPSTQEILVQLRHILAELER